MDSVDLVSLIEQHSGIRLTRKASTAGGEYCGYCPFCQAGQDRFLVWPNSARPHYRCRVCERNGDAIQFLRDYCSMAFIDACVELGIDADTTGYTPNSTSQSAQDGPPSVLWQEAAHVFIERAERYLWHPGAIAGQQALAYLRGRGLHDETIKKARLGYCPLGKDGRWYSDSFEHWGLNPDMLTPAQREKGCLRIPPGIVIPWLESDRVWKLAIKRLDEPDPKKCYGQVMGSAEGLYGVDSVQYNKPAMMVEGEFDALSISQEAGDLIACVATGSTTRGRSGRWIGDLAIARYVLQSFDDDDAGDAGADYWIQTLSHAMRWAPYNDRWSDTPRFKDPNDMLKRQEEFKQFTGLSLRGWVEQGIWMAELPISEERTTLARVTEPLSTPDYAHHIQVQEHFERLCISERVNTSKGPGTIWDVQQLRSHVERGHVRVSLDSRKDDVSGTTELFSPNELEPLIEELDLSF